MAKETMHPLAELIGYYEGRELLTSCAQAIESTETVALLDAAGRVLAEAVISEVDVPPFNRAAMDGYAVVAESTFGAGRFNPKRLPLADVVHAGEAPRTPVAKETCVQIATGAPIPEGADAVVMVEYTERQDGEVEIFQPVYPGQNIMSRGQDIKQGQVVLRAGTFLTPAKIGALAAIGKARVKVYVKPKAAVMPTGNEVVPPGRPLEMGQIYDINTYTLSALLKEHGWEPVVLGIVPDEREAIREAMERATQLDLVLLSGGSSVGERDILMEVISEMGEVKFHGIAVKPGKPTLCAVVNGKLVVGMPGYPTSCLTNAYGFMIPVLRRIARLPEYQPRTLKATLAHRVTSTLGRHQFLTVRLDGNVAHQAFKESGAITSMAEADGYIEIPERVDLVEKGAQVEVILFDS